MKSPSHIFYSKYEKDVEIIIFQSSNLKIVSYIGCMYIKVTYTTIFLQFVEVSLHYRERENYKKIQYDSNFCEFLIMDLNKCYSIQNKTTVY